MNLIERYLHEVGRYLPRKNRADIQAELHSVLIDSLEARPKGAAGDEEVVALLKEFGPPQKVAASYWPEGQYLIGPALFPTFRTVVGIALAVLVLVNVLVFGINLAFNSNTQAGLELLRNFPGSILSMLGAIVLVFYVLQLFDVRLKDSEKEWDPRTLPVIEESEAVKRGETIFEIVFGLIFLGLLLTFPGWVALTTTNGERMVISDPVLIAYLPLIAISLFLGLSLDVILLWRGRWGIGIRLVKIGIDLFGLIVLALLIAGHNAWLAKHAAGDFFGYLRTLPGTGSIPDAETVQILVMHAVRLSLVIAMVVTVVETVRAGYRLIRRLVGRGTPLSIPLTGNETRQ